MYHSCEEKVCQLRKLKKGSSINWNPLIEAMQLKLSENLSEAVTQCYAIDDRTEINRRLTLDTASRRCHV